MNKPMPNRSLSDLMREATRLTQTGQLAEAQAALQQALGAGAAAAFPGPGAQPAAGPATGSFPGMGGTAAPAAWSAQLRDAATAWAKSGGQGPVIDMAALADLPGLGGAAPGPNAGSASSEPAVPDSFSTGSLSHGGRSWRYKLYVPPAAATATPQAPLPLVVMLHGCTQHADDFAAGTGMNALARAQGCYVLYPEQPQAANPQRCWNWFKHNHQQRGSGEPAGIVALVQAVAASHPVDPRRVYVAGLSAGGAMTAIVAAAYPDVFAAAGVHSGLPGDAAGNLQEALAAMQGGARGPSTQARTPRPARPVPTIVFHGDQDVTVHLHNGHQLLAAALAGAPAELRSQLSEGQAPGGRRFSRQHHAGADGRSHAELWVVHGAGHAWSGGQPAGSYTDAGGPDASAEMLRFFSQHQLPG